MMGVGGAKTWWTASELADLALPALPRVKRKVNELAASARWALRVDASGSPLARPRAGVRPGRTLLRTVPRRRHIPGAVPVWW